MPVTPTYPGVYIEEVPSSVRTIVGVATSITAFIGRALRGPLDDPVRVQSYAEYQRTFGGLWSQSTMSYAVHHYLLNGGRDALIVRVADETAAAATITLTGSVSGDLTLEAANPGDWGENLQAIVDYDTKDKDEATPVLFNLTIQEVEDDVVAAVEVFRNLSVDEDNARYVKTVLESKSDLVRVKGTVPDDRPDESGTDINDDYIPAVSNNDGDDGGAIDFDQIADTDLQNDRMGLWALDDADLFNLLCIPPFDRETNVDSSTWAEALAYCKKRRAMLIVDPPADSTLSWDTPADVADATDGVDSLNLRDENAAIYFPQVKMADSLQENRLASFAPCGVVAGIMARTDAQRGVWKAPAGQEATMLGVRGLAYQMTDGENGQLNPLGVNCLRTFPVVGHVVWGARTLEGADRLASEWKYLPVRRLALYIEESLYRGTQWVVFEPNDEPLWAQIRLNVGAFMHNLFRQGAFQGTTPREAYFVKCDSETTTQNDIDQGIVNILVGFAPLKPAEFVIIKISQIAGEIQT